MTMGPPAGAEQGEGNVVCVSVTDGWFSGSQPGICPCQTSSSLAVCLLGYWVLDSGPYLILKQMVTKIKN